MVIVLSQGQTVVKDEDNQKQKEYLATVQYLLKDGKGRRLWVWADCRVVVMW